MQFSDCSPFVCNLLDDALSSTTVCLSQTIVSTLAFLSYCRLPLESPMMMDGHDVQPIKQLLIKPKTIKRFIIYN